MSQELKRVVFNEISKAYGYNRLHPVVRSLVEVAKSPDPKLNPLRNQLAISFEGGGVGGSAATCYEGAAAEVVVRLAFGKKLNNCVRVSAGSSGGGPNAAFAREGLLNRFKHSYPLLFCKPPLVNLPLTTKPPFVDQYLLAHLLRGSRSIVHIDYLHEMIDNHSTLSGVHQEADEASLLLLATKVDPNLPAKVEDRRLVLTDFADRKSVLRGIQGGCQIPILSGPPYEVQDGVLALDGGIVEHIPYLSVVRFLRENFVSQAEDTKVLVFSSVPWGVDHDQMSFFEAQAAKFYTKYILGDPNLLPLWLTRRARASKIRKLLREKQQNKIGPDFASIIAPKPQNYQRVRSKWSHSYF